ncbi:sigma-70 family RNA polymerase sigma factor [Alcaligenaceae bacterium]|nr:sigma-70 family RNA polymerase sigma factor [Alcaligenaceae bacterium]
MSKTQNTSKTNDAPLACVLQAWQGHEKELFAFLTHRLDDRDLAQDLLQEVFVKSIRQGQRFCALYNPRAWLFQVARNSLIDSVRHIKRFEEWSDHLVVEPPEERSPVDELDTCIGRSLPGLGVKDRHIIDACDLQGQTVRAYAEANELALAAAKSRLLRARKRLRDLLVKYCQIRFDETGQVCCHVPHPLS